MPIALQLLLMPLIAFFAGLGLILMLRKLRARIERRIGPPWLQPLYDIAKLYGKETQVSHGPMHDIAIMVLLGGVIAVTWFIPVPGMGGLSPEGDLITLVYLMMVPSLGMALGVGSCANPYGSIGISRALTAMLAYDVPLMIAVAGVAIAYGTTDMAQIAAAQQADGWGLAQMPLLAIAALIAVHAMLGKEPFEIYVAPAEIASGPMVEMSGRYLGSLFVMQAFQFYSVSALYVVLFLGGGGVGWAGFLLKVALVAMVPILVTNLYPRYRADRVLQWMWKWPTGIALLGLLSVIWT